MRRSLIIACIALLLAAAPATAATWRGHTVKARLVGQIDASPCPTASCLRGIVGVIVDGHDVHDNVVRCGAPHPRILAFDHGRHHHRYAWYLKARACGRDYWWRFR